MSMFIANILLAFVWAGMAGGLSARNLAVGFALGYVMLLFARPAIGRSRYFGKVWQVFWFLLYFIKELIKANLQVAYDVITPTHYSKPGTVAIPLDAKTDFEITLLANLITLTPGTLSLDVSKDRRVLYIHAMFIDTPDAIRKEVKEGLEKRMLEVLR